MATLKTTTIKTGKVTFTKGLELGVLTIWVKHARKTNSDNILKWEIIEED